MPIHVNPDRRRDDPEASSFAYEDAPEGESLLLLIIPLTPLVDEQCTEKALQQPAAVNGRFRRQVQMPKFRQGLYKRSVFQACIKGWDDEPGTKPMLLDQHGAPLAYSEEAKAALSETHNGILDFGFDIATALGQISADQVREERSNFRRAPEIPSGLAEPEL